MTRTLRVAVLMGGPSAEHAISLQSGRGVVEALRGCGWRVVDPITVPVRLTVPEARTWVRAALDRVAPDVVFLALHGAFGEDGTVQDICEELHLAYTGSDAQASRLGMDKVLSRQRFAAAGLAVPRWTLIDASASGDPLPGWSFPIVVKPVDQGSSIGVSLVREPAQLPAALAETRRYGPQALIEEFIEGREMTAGVLGDEALPVVEIRPTHPFFDFSAKYTSGATSYLVPAPLDAATTRAVQVAGLAAHRALGCRHLSRSDLILTSSGVAVILELNTIPGFTPTSLIPKAAACMQLAYADVCERLVQMAWHDSQRLAQAA